MQVGILALQGDVAEHEAALQRVGAAATRVRHPVELDDLDALVLPGGESTTIGQLAAEFGLVEPLRRFVDGGRPVWGTCAGLILLARDAGRAQPLVGGLDIEVDRNHFGRQVDSFEVDLAIRHLPGPTFRAIFIRAPAITRAGPDVEVLARLDGGEIVAAQQANVLVTAFHPELAEDDRVHAYFLRLAAPDPAS